MMNALITRYLQNLTIEDLNYYAQKQEIYFSESELNFSFDFIKNHYEAVMLNPSNFNIHDYESYYSEDNFMKINALYEKYKHYLR